MKKLLLSIYFCILSLSMFSQFTQEWVHTYNDTITDKSADNSIEVLSDSLGNLYAYGTTDNNFLLVKYDSAGNVRWSKTLNGSTNGVDVATDMMMDSAGNVYITGKIINNLTSGDMMVAKYDSLGNRIWLVQYDINIANDQGNAMAINALGEVYVAGFSNGNNMLLKIDASGTPVWSKIYMGSTGGGQYYDVAIDPQQNIIVTGSILTTTQSYNWITIKYTPAGNLVWAKTVNGSSNAQDLAGSITIDELSNVYVAGYLVNGSNDEDAYIVSYDSAGVIRWSSTYNGIDNDRDMFNKVKYYNNNVYVVGTVHETGSYDVITKAFSSSGSTLWTQLHATPHTESGLDIAIDTLGNIFIAGQTMIPNTTYVYYGFLLKYTNSGLPVWLKNVTQYAESVCIDPYQNVVITGGGTNDSINEISTMKHSQVGAQIWLERYNYGYSNFDDKLSGMKIDSNGNIYIGGFSKHLHGVDWTIYKLNSSGTLEWLKRRNGINTITQERVQVIEIDHHDNLLVAGYSTSGNMQVGIVEKYDPNGNLLWSYTYNPGVVVGGSVWINRLIVDDNDNIYFAGFVPIFSTSNNEMYIVKLNSNGNLVWQDLFGNVYSDNAHDIYIDTTGNVYLSGMRRYQFNQDQIVLRKYNPSGSLLWDRSFSGNTGGYSSLSTKIIVDNAENIYVSGLVNNVASGLDFAMTKYDPSGNFKWYKSYLSGNDWNTTMGSDGYIYTIYDSTNINNFKTYKILKCDTLGNTVWIKTGLPGTLSVLEPITYRNDGMIQKNGKLYIIGADSLTGTGRDMTLWQYDTLGNFENSVSFDAGDNNMNEYASQFYIHDNGNVYMSGFGEINSGKDIYTIKYCQNAPSPITSIGGADSIVCSGVNNLYQVPNTGSSNYIWSYSGSGATITPYSNQAIVNFNSSATAGVLSLSQNNACGSIQDVSLNITINNPVAVNLTTSADTVCSTGASVLLVGTPSGGVYSGQGVAGASFDPSIALPGSNTITYSYTDSNTCSSIDTSSIFVDVCTTILTSSPYSILLYPNPASSEWNIETTDFVGAIFELYDLSGRLVRTISLNSIQTKMQREELSSGIYFYKINKQNNDVLNGKLIVN